MDVFDKAGKAVGDVIAKARERERVRLEDRLRQLDLVDSCARTIVHRRKHRAGFTWRSEVTEASLQAISAAVMIGDDELEAAVDVLAEVQIPSDPAAVGAVLEAAYRPILKRLAILRQETLADD